MRQTKLIPGEFIGKVDSTNARYLARVNLGGSLAARYAAYANWYYALNQTGLYGDILILPDRKTIIVAGNQWHTSVTGNKSLIKVDLETGAITLAGTPPAGIVRHAILSPDNLYIVLASDSTPFVQVYDVATLTLQATVPDISPAYAYALAFIGTTRLAVAGGGATGPEGNGRLLIYSWPGLVRQPGPASIDMPYVSSAWEQMAVTPDGSRLVMAASTGVSGNPGTLLVYNTATWSQLVTTAVVPISAYVREGELKISPNGKYAVTRANSVSTGNHLIVIDLTTSPPSKVPMTISPAPAAGGVSRFQWLDNERILFISNLPAVTTTPPASIHDCAWVIHVPTSSVLDVRADTGMQSMTTQSALVPGAVYRKLAGTVHDGSSNPLSRTVVALDKETLQEIGRATSSAVDGSFTMIVFSPFPALVLALGSGAEVTKLFDSVVPVVAP